MFGTFDSIYRAGRKAGFTAQNAFHNAKYLMEFKEELARLDFDYEGDGAVYSYEDEDSGVTITYEIRYEDFYMHPGEEYDCYSEEDIKAWENDDWTYMFGIVTATLGSHEIVESLGGIESGDYWQRPEAPLDSEEQVMSVLLDHYSIDSMKEYIQELAIKESLLPV